MVVRYIGLSIGQLAEEALHRGPVAIPPPCACLQPGGFHETCNTLSGDADATLLQGSVNARRAIGALAGVEDGANLRQQRFVFYGAVTNTATAPCVKARWRNAVTLTQHLHPKPVPLRIYEREEFRSEEHTSELQSLMRIS